MRTARTRGVLARLARAALALLATGCGGAIFSIESHRTQNAYTDQALAAFERQRAAGPLTKREVLATLGPPVHVVGRDDGEIFLYRRLARDTSTLNLNPATVSAFGPMPPIPLYLGSDSSGRDDTMMVFFDRDGTMTDASIRLGIGVTGDSPAARIGQGVQEILE